MANVEQGCAPQNSLTVRPASAEGASLQHTDDDGLSGATEVAPEVAAEVMAFLRYRFPQYNFEVILRRGQMIIQDSAGPAESGATRTMLVPSDDPSQHAPLATCEGASAPTVPVEALPDCALCITAFLQQYSVSGHDCYTPVTVFCDAFQQWCRAVGQTLFSEEEILATLMEHWSVYQGAHEGWILDEYTVKRASYCVSP